MNAQRVLLTCGSVWVLIGNCFAFYLGPQVIPKRNEKAAHLVEAFRQLADGDLQKAEMELKSGLKTETNFKHQVHLLHSHALSLAFLALLFGLMQSFLGLSERIKNISAWILVVGAILYPIGLLIEPVHMAFGTPIVVVGVVLTIISVIANFIGVLKFVSPVGKSKA